MQVNDLLPWLEQISLEAFRLGSVGLVATDLLGGLQTMRSSKGQAHCLNALEEGAVWKGIRV